MTEPRASRWLRLALVIVALTAWFWTQSLIAKRPVPPTGIGDAIFDLTAPAHRYLVEHPFAANALLVVSSAFIDLLGIFLLAWAIFGPSVRPFLGLLMVFALRQIVQLVCALPAPPDMIWRNPGVPSLLVTYSVANDLFFSGHTAIAVLGAVELSRIGKRWLTVAGVIIVVFEVATVLVLRAHYTMDVFAGAVTALLIGGVAGRLAPACDRRLARLVA